MDCLVSNAALCVAQQSSDDRETHERSSGGGKSQAAQDRRIDILPAEDDDGTITSPHYFEPQDIYHDLLIYIFICGSTRMAIVFYIPPSSLPLSSLFTLSFAFFPSEVPPPPENATAAILSYAVSHLHEGTGKLRNTCADTVSH